MPVYQVALLGGVVGVPLGYALQRTQLCFNSAYREVILHRNTVLVRMLALAVLVQMVALAFLLQFGLGGVQLSVVPFYWLAAIIGGFLFGIAMVYAEGCSSTVWYRVGNGNIGALITLIGFAVGEVTVSYGLLKPLRDRLFTYEVQLPGDQLATVPNALSVSPWLVIVPIVALIGWWLWRGAAGSYLGGWDWRKGGLVLGALGIFAWLVAWRGGWYYGVGVVGATGQYLLAFSQGIEVLNWGSFMVLAMPVGAFIAAIRTRQFKWQVPPLNSSARYLLAGAAMGITATLAGGCNIGHGFTGLPTLALSSITATGFTFLGAWAGNYLRFIRPAKSH